MAVPRIDVVVFRPTDGDTEVQVFIDGKLSNDYNEHIFDDGNSDELSDVRENAYGALTNPEYSAELRESLRAGYVMELESDYITDDSKPCAVCGEGVTPYRTYTRDTSPVVGYLDAQYSLTGSDGHPHTT